MNEPAPPPRDRDRRRLWAGAALAVAFGTFSFALSYTVEQRLDRLGAFDSHNLLFDSDAQSHLRTLSDGWNVYGRNRIHPNLANYFNPPVRIVAEIDLLGRWTGLSEHELRREVALLVVPVAAGLKSAVVVGLFLLAGFSLLQASLAAALSAVSFSQVVFGSIPDHWALSGLILAVGHLLVVDTARRRGRVRWWAWIAVAALAAGITVTNLLIVGILLAAALLATGGRFLPALGRTAAAMAGGLGASQAFAKLGNLVYGYRPGKDLENLWRWIQRFVSEDPGGRLLRFPTAVVDGLAPGELGWTEIATGGRAGQGLRLTLEGSASVFSLSRLPGLGLFLLAIAGGVRGLRSAPPLRALAAASFAAVAFNGLFHAFWGFEYFLYSQHYQVSLVALLAGVMPGAGRARAAGTAIFGLLVAGVAVVSGLRLHDLLSLVEAAGR